jgi:hypothetical protein
VTKEGLGRLLEAEICVKYERIGMLAIEFDQRSMPLCSGSKSPLAAAPKQSSRRT